MPSIASKVRDLIIGFGELAFNTAQVLCCGSRNAVDIELCRLVKKRVITRLAAGIFVLNCESGGISSQKEIAGLKASRFGKKIVEAVSGVPTGLCYFTDGCRSSFQTIYGRIYFKYCSSSKRKGQFAVSKPVHEELKTVRKQGALPEKYCSELSQATLKLADCLYDLLTRLDFFLTTDFSEHAAVAELAKLAES